MVPITSKQAVKKIEQVAEIAAYLLAHKDQIAVLFEDCKSIQDFPGLLGDNEDDLAGEVEAADTELWSAASALRETAKALDKAAKLRNRIIKKSGSNNALSVVPTKHPPIIVASK